MALAANRSERGTQVSALKEANRMAATSHISPHAGKQGRAARLASRVIAASAHAPKDNRRSRLAQTVRWSVTALSMARPFQFANRSLGEGLTRDRAADIADARNRPRAVLLNRPRHERMIRI